MKYDVADLSLAAGGKKRILWADNDMPALAAIRKRFAKNKPLKGKNVSACLHVTAEEGFQDSDFCHLQGESQHVLQTHQCGD